MSDNELFCRGNAMLTAHKFAQRRMTGWFEFQEIKMLVRQNHPAPDAGNKAI